MANVVNGRVLKLDTAVASYAAMALPRNPAPYLISKIEWFSPAAIGDTFTIQDAQGNVLVTGKCEVALQSQIFNFNPEQQWGKSVGWFLQQITSGILYVYYR